MENKVNIKNVNTKELSQVLGVFAPALQKGSLQMVGKAEGGILMLTASNGLMRMDCAIKGNASSDVQVIFETKAFTPTVVELAKVNDACEMQIGDNLKLIAGGAEVQFPLLTEQKSYETDKEILFELEATVGCVNEALLKGGRAFDLDKPAYMQRVCFEVKPEVEGGELCCFSSDGITISYIDGIRINKVTVGNDARSEETFGFSFHGSMVKTITPVLALYDDEVRVRVKLSKKDIFLVVGNFILSMPLASLEVWEAGLACIRKMLNNIPDGYNADVKKQDLVSALGILSATLSDTTDLLQYTIEVSPGKEEFEVALMNGRANLNVSVEGQDGAAEKMVFNLRLVKEVVSWFGTSSVNMAFNSSVGAMLVSAGTQQAIALGINR